MNLNGISQTIVGDTKISEIKSLKGESYVFLSININLVIN